MVLDLKKEKDKDSNFNLNILLPTILLHITTT